MKLGFAIVLACAAVFYPSPSPHADEVRPDEVLAKATRDVVARSAFEDNALLELEHRALLDATGAEASLCFPYPPGTRLAAGPIQARQVLDLVGRDERILVAELSEADLRRLVERSARAFAEYTWEDGRSLLRPGGDDSSLVSVDGVSYLIDLTAPPGRRVVDFATRKGEADTTRTLRVAATVSTLQRLGLPANTTGSEPWLKDALVARLRKLKTIDGSCDHNWSVLPDYATTPERGLIDRLVRQGVAPRQEVLQLFPDQPARRGELAYWLARAFGWRERKLMGAFPDVPDSLEPWVDALVKRRVLGMLATEEYFQPFAAVRLPMAVDWCANAARSERYPISNDLDQQSFRRGLLAGTSWPTERRAVGRDTISRAQMLGLISNARFPWVRVLHTTDLHGAMEPSPRPGRSRGGSAVVASWIAALRAENPEGTVLTDGGDVFQGTMISNLAHGRPMVEQMNRLGYAATAIGNHEFDWSVDTLARRVREMRFSALAANITDDRGQPLPWLRADTMFVRRGVRVGLFGLAFPGTAAATTPQNVAALRFGDDSTAAATRAPALRARGADAVIAIGHIPGVIDSARVVGGRLAMLARGVRGVDAWLGGHSHTWVDGEVGGVPTLIPASHGMAIAVCDLVVDPIRHRVVERSHRLVSTWGDAVTPDSAMQALVGRWARAVEPEAQLVVGSSAQTLGKIRGGECAIGSLVADVMRRATQADVALQNNGGLRAELLQGPVTRGAIYQVIPFENTIVTMTLTGAEIRQVLEEGL